MAPQGPLAQTTGSNWLKKTLVRELIQKCPRPPKARRGGRRPCGAKEGLRRGVTRRSVRGLRVRHRAGALISGPSGTSDVSSRLFLVVRLHRRCADVCIDRDSLSAASWRALTGRIRTRSSPRLSRWHLYDERRGYKTAACITPRLSHRSNG